MVPPPAGEYTSCSGLVPRSPELRRVVPLKSLTTMSLALLTAAAPIAIVRVWPSVRANSWRGPHSVAVVAPANG